MNSKLIIMTLSAALLVCCFASPSYAQESWSNTVPDKNAIVRAVLKAELERQFPSFRKIRTLSTENISFGDVLEINGQRFKLIDGANLRVKGGSYFEYLMFASFRREGETVSVTLAYVVEGEGCFGPYYKNVDYETYVAHKGEFGWLAEFRYSSSPQPPMKPLGNSFFVKGRER